jgi:uncharacterized membrane protein
MNQEIERRKEQIIVRTNLEGIVKNELVDPAIVAAYAEILSGSPEKILAMIEKQLRHRRFVEKVECFSKNFIPILGLIFAMMLTILCFAASVLLLVFGWGITTGIFFGLTLLGLVSRFIIGTRNPKSEVSSSVVS